MESFGGGSDMTRCRTAWRRFRRLPRRWQAVSWVGLVVALSVAGSVTEDTPTTTAVDASEPAATPRRELPEASVSTTSTSKPPTSTTTTPAVNAASTGESAVVERIVDGDTLVLTSGVKVRLIGVDTPETKKPGSPVECFGPQASDFTTSAVGPGTAVTLVYDAERLDRYGRTLVYLYRTSDDLFLNLALVRDGFAQVATFPPNIAHVEEFLDAQRQARDEARGLWGADCAEQTDTATPPPAAAAPAPARAVAPPSPAPTPATTTTPPTAPAPAVASPPPASQPSGGCHPSYDPCVPTASDADCASGSGNGPVYVDGPVNVIGPDDYGLDSDHDSIGCER